MTFVNLDRALANFDAAVFAKRHGGRKESRGEGSYEYLFPCPACGSSRLRWNARKGSGAWICWGCHRTGDTMSLVQLLERTDELGAIHFILDGYVGGDAPVELASMTKAAVLRDRQRLLRLPQMAWPDGVDLLVWHPQMHTLHLAGWQYLAKRGIETSQTVAYKLGFGRMGRLRQYILFPIFMDGGMVYWQGRASWDPPAKVSPEERKAWIEETHYRKTLNPIVKPGEATASDAIFNYDRAMNQEHVVICEGPIDAMKVGVHAVALLGKIAAPQKIERLRRMRTRRYTVYLDRGEEEYECARRLAAELSAYAPTFIAVPPEGHDPGSLTAMQNAAVIRDAEPFRPVLASDLKP